MNQQIALAPLWMFCAGYFFGLSFAGAAVIRAHAVKAMGNIPVAVINLLLVLHLVPIFLGVQFSVHGLVAKCDIVEQSSLNTAMLGLGVIVSATISIIAIKKLHLKLL